jgi:hypothetical protein
VKRAAHAGGGIRAVDLPALSGPATELLNSGGEAAWNRRQGRKEVQDAEGGGG